MPQPTLTPERAAAAARLAMRRQVAATIAAHDVGLRPEQRTLSVFKAGQPDLAARYGDAALLARRRLDADTAGYRHQPPAGRLCGWCVARALASRWQLPRPRYTADTRALLGEPCTPRCRAALLPKPKPARRRAPAATPRPAPAASYAALVAAAATANRRRSATTAAYERLYGPGAAAAAPSAIRARAQARR